MKIRVNPDTETAQSIIAALKENDLYCPCKIDKIPETKCPCIEFRQTTEVGLCHCGLYEKYI